MSNKFVKMSYLDFREKARQLKKTHNCGSARSYEILAKSYGFSSHNSLLEFLDFGKAVIDHDEFQMEIKKRYKK